MNLNYDILRYEVHLFVGKRDIGGNNYFYCEEDAVAFAEKYVAEHPKWTAQIYYIQRAKIGE